MPMVVFFQMFLQESDRRKLLVVLAGFVVLLDEALVLCQFLEGFLSLLRRVENIAIDLIAQKIGFRGLGKLFYLLHYYHLLACRL